MKIKVENQRLYLEPPETAEGTREYLRVEFSFSEEWKGLTKTAFSVERRVISVHSYWKMTPVPCQQRLLPHLVGSGYPCLVHGARRSSRLISRAFLHQQP